MGTPAGGRPLQAESVANRHALATMTTIPRSGIAVSMITRPGKGHAGSSAAKSRPPVEDAGPRSRQPRHGLVARALFLFTPLPLPPVFAGMDARLAVVPLVFSVVCAAAPQRWGDEDASRPDAAPSSDASPASDVRDAAFTTDAALTLTPGCSPATLAGCSYLPEPRLTEMPLMTAEVSYADESGAVRTIEIGLHRPEGAPLPAPVVIWSHGGSDGVARAAGVGAEWARVFTAAGYLVVAIAHRGRDDASRAGLCRALGLDAAGCATFVHLSGDRPHDVRAVLDWIDEQAAPGGALAGAVDRARVAHAGHSAGAGGVMTVAGASRDFAGQLRVLSDPRPLAFIACSPQGPGGNGFVDDSFDAIARPTLVLTGAGDDTNGSLGENRRVLFSRLAPGEKYLGWIADDGARHNTFNFDTDACLQYAAQQGLDPERCQAFLPWLASAALAFLDAEVRGHGAGDAPARARALAYLASDDLVVLSSGTMEWSRR
jgi:predicted dienelactone hydrolase